MQGHKVHLVAHFQGQSAPSTQQVHHAGCMVWMDRKHFSLYSSPIANHGGSITNHSG